MRNLKQRNILSFLFVICLVLMANSSVHAQSGAQVGLLAPVQVPLGGSVQVPITVNNVKDLYALDITLKFDPALVQVVDADTATDGIQIALGTFLDPGLLLFNTVDNEAGTIRFAMSQYNPSDGKSGKGIVLVVTFAGKAEGETSLAVTDLTLSDRSGVLIPSQGVEGKLTVSASAPTQAATYPAAQATGLIVINTFTPTPLPTNTPTPQPTNAPTKEPVAAVTQIEPTAAAQSSAPVKGSSNYFMAKNWWIVLVLLLAVVAAAIYFGFFKRTHNGK